MKHTIFALLAFLSTAVWADAPMPKDPPAMKFSDPLPANLFVELGRVINPTVVNISTTATFRNRARDPMLDMLEEFYGVPRQQMPDMNKPQQLALGTGFIVREDGLIVTNAHVVKGAEHINVQLIDNQDKVYEAKLIGSDERSDIALIKIKPDRKLPVATLGSSKDLKVGEWVAAFGNPFGHSHTMTKGIISSVGRQIGEINKFPLIQTDASINPGNSGGPLVDSRGFVIGVNSAIDARAQGIGFAIPIDEVRKVLPELESRGSIRKGYLGVVLGDLDPRAAEADGIEGSVIIRVDPGTPAYKGKIKAYDIVTEFNGRKVKNSVELSDAVADAPIGKSVPVKVLRQQGQSFKKLDLDVTVTERPGEAKLATRDPISETKGQKVPFNVGFWVADLTPQLREGLRLSSELKKPVVTQVDSNSVASFVGITEGDIILDVNKTEVTTAADVVKAFKKGNNSMRLARGNRVIYLTLTAK
jgi:serine protease Do